MIRGAGVSFAEIDVLLCNKPTPDELIAELPSLPKECECLDVSHNLVPAYEVGVFSSREL